MFHRRRVAVANRRGPCPSEGLKMRLRRHRMATRARVGAVGLVVAILASGLSLVAASPAFASGASCWAGFDGDSDTWVWGSCSGFTSDMHAKWRLHESCTWGLHSDSSYYTDNRRIDINCPAGTRAAAYPEIQIVFS
jgi:hypothetical protein